MHSLHHHRIKLLIIAVLPFLGPALTAAAADQISYTSSGVTIRLDPASGDYAVHLAKLDWHFDGSIGRPATRAEAKVGHDALGDYNAIVFDWTDDGPKTGEIRSYVRPTNPLVQFILTCHSAQAKAPAAFPTLQPPRGLRLFSYTDSTFSPPRFNGQAGGTPWLMFDDAGHAAILSPASNFMVASLHAGAAPDAPTLGVEGGGGGDTVTVTTQSTTVAAATVTPSATPATSQATTRPRRATSRPVDRVNRDRRVTTDATIASGFDSKLKDLLPEFSHHTLLAFGDGINSTWETWGRAMTDLTGKHRPANDADVGLKNFGYWTDNGAGYYYNYDHDKGYAGTLLALRKTFDQLGIPLGYLQLDSWWYIKSNLGPEGKEGDPFKNKNLPPGSWNLYGGLIEYVAHKDLFPEGLAKFHGQVGLPFVTHNRWVDLHSPYREKYKISGVAAVDPKWWDDVADYLKSAGVVTYEQDWLDRIYRYSPEFQTTLGVGDAFMDNMSRACRERGLTLQYCMELPRHYLQGTRYDNLTTVRVSDDHFMRDRWERMLYVSRMASALGEWPWVDTFGSRETPNLLLATLTAGMVGVGDKMSEIDPANIRKVIRADGVIIKPDTAITPTDQTWLDDAAGKESPMIAAAYTQHDGGPRTAYVFAYPRNEKQIDIHFHPADLGIAGEAYVYEPATGEAKRVATGATFYGKFKDESPKTAWAYYVVAPVTRSGIALLGDKAKFASMGRQRMTTVEESPDGVRATITFAPGEPSVSLFGYAGAEPHCGGQNVKVDRGGYDVKTSEFRFDVARPDTGSTVTVTLSK